MKVITKYKTTEIIKMAKNNDVIVCCNTVEVHKLMNQAKELNIKINPPITFEEFLERKYSATILTQILIDNLDRCLNKISKANVKAITLRDLY